MREPQIPEEKGANIHEIEASYAYIKRGIQGI
jgi:hypothetical protein